MQQPPEPGAELPPKWLIEPEMRADLCDLVGGRVVAREHRGRVARRQVQQQKDADRDHQHHRYGRGQPADDVGEQGRVTPAQPIQTGASAMLRLSVTPYTRSMFHIGITSATGSQPRVLVR